LSLPVLELDCPTCVKTIEKELNKLDGVDLVRVNFLMKRIIVEYNPDEIAVPDIEQRIEELGYRLAYKKYEGFLEKISRSLFGRKEIELRNIADHEFEKLVLESNKPVILLFSSSNCPSCRALKPRLKKTLDELGEQVYLYEMDVSKTSNWEQYNIINVPTILLFKQGNVVNRLIGHVKQRDIENMMSKELTNF
jgi:thiol-disulfide isomerase/thioredoxin/copper chaperone CopZ